MAGILARAKARAQASTAEAASTKGTVWLLSPEDPLNSSVERLIKLEDDAKALEGQMSVHKLKLKQFGDQSFASACVDKGKLPDSPLIIQSAAGQSVKFVVTDRSNQYAVKADQVVALESLLGKDGAEKILYEEYSFRLNSEILAVDGVAQAVEKALEAVVKKLVQAGTISYDQGESLVQVDSKKTFKPKTLERLIEICGRETARVAGFLQAMGASATRFIKV